MQLTQERKNKIELEALYLVQWYADAGGEVAVLTSVGNGDE
jgi:hypothetical protein